MLKRIANVRDFGVLHNFSGNTLPEFGSFNLIYGWNYSGKTTLSRLFRCLETGALHPDYQDAKFSLIHVDGTNRDHEFATATSVKVFNEDFRKDHLLWDDSDGFNPVLLLGSGTIEKQGELASKKEELKLALADGVRFQTESVRLREVIAQEETECGGLIARELPVGRFNRVNVRQTTDRWRDTIPQPLDSEQFKTEKAKVNAEQKEELPELYVDTRSLEGPWAAAMALLGEGVGSAATIQRLAENGELNRWVETGLHLHRDATHCEFCEGPLSAERLVSLDAHFSRAFVDLKARIAKAISWLAQRAVQVNGAAYGRAQFYSDMHGEHSEAGEGLRNARDAFNASLEDLAERLRKKSDNPFETVEPPAGAPGLADLAACATRFQTLIAENNRRTIEFKKSRQAAVEALKSHYISTAMLRIDLLRLRTEIQDITRREEAASSAVKALEAEIDALQLQLSESVKGAEAINDILRHFFGKDDIKIRVTEGDRFQLVRAGIPAKNLSEGERTAIAFCYFIAKLLENGNELADTIVYIDDPISSLDSHHLLHVNAFLRNTFLKDDPSAKPRFSCLAKQVFISTHNYEFFHLTWDWMTKKKSSASSSAFMMERTDGDGVIRSRLVECPTSILQFRSEYLFLYHQLLAYAHSPSNDAIVIFNLGNMARRFVEGYVAFKFLEFGSMDNRLPSVIADSVKCELARKFMHHYSHTLTRGGGMKLPDMAEARAAVTAILEGVENHDPVHFAALRDAG